MASILQTRIENGEEERDTKNFNKDGHRAAGLMIRIVAQSPARCARGLSLANEMAKAGTHQILG